MRACGGCSSGSIRHTGAVAAALAAAAAAASAAAAAAPPAPAAATLTLAAAAPLFTTAPGWPGLNLDTASLHNRLDLTDAYLCTLTRQLHDAAGPGGPPLTLRVGGTASNHMVFVPGDGPTQPTRDGGTVITGATLAGVHAFAAAVGAEVIFGLPYQTGADGAWLPGNATAVWASVAAANLSSFVGWSLGNELIGPPPFNASRYGADYVAFRAAMDASAPPWARAAFGPSAAGFPGDAVVRAFAAAAAAALAPGGGALSFHAYAFKNCSLGAYTSKAGIERMDYYLAAYAAARDAASPGLPLYLEEAATQAGGGCDGLSNRFVSGFWWVHTLGLAGARGVARVTRQDLAGWSFASGASHYPLAGPPGWVNETSPGGPPTPHPDFFTTLLWRQLVGDAVLGASLAAAPAVNASVGVHAWCARGAGPGAVVLTYINTGSAPVELAVVLLGGKGKVAGSSRAGALSPLPVAPRVEYALTAPRGDLTADGVLLNGSPLGVDARGALPALPVPGAAVPAGGSAAPPPLLLPPQAYGFVVLPAAGAPACGGGGGVG